MYSFFYTDPRNEYASCETMAKYTAEDSGDFELVKNRGNSALFVVVHLRIVYNISVKFVYNHSSLQTNLLIVLYKIVTSKTKKFKAPIT